MNHTITHMWCKHLGLVTTPDRGYYQGIKGKDQFNVA